MSGGPASAFGMKPGEISGPIQGGANGIVLKMVEVQQPTPEQMKQDWDKAKEALLQQKREQYEDLYVENLRDSSGERGQDQNQQEGNGTSDHDDRGIVTMR